MCTIYDLAFIDKFKSSCLLFGHMLMILLLYMLHLPVTVVFFSLNTPVDNVTFILQTIASIPTSISKEWIRA